eukprot:TRINITY_DN4527_c0_g2_i1.p1 TRINITY_DN4527_c0_g2~~TRINITY_DN4527_c0_g2_i1.p1  ORF type:complete len:1301 (+),score=317.10 TRINITY_DN4527_c0_g2_i1:80-3982(+)
MLYAARLQALLCIAGIVQAQVANTGHMFYQPYMDGAETGQGNMRPTTACFLDGLTLGSTQYTGELWVKALSGSSGLMSVANAANDNFLTFELTGSFAIKSPTAYSTRRAPDGQWHHLALSVDQDAGLINFYLDGVLVLPRPDNPNMREQDFALPLMLCLGMDQDSYLGGFDAKQGGVGWIDEVRIWNVFRDEASIQSLMHTAITDATDGLVAVWNFETPTTLPHSQNEALSGARPLTFGNVLADNVFAPPDGTLLPERVRGTPPLYGRTGTVEVRIEDGRKVYIPMTDLAPGRVAVSGVPAAGVWDFDDASQRYTYIGNVGDSFTFTYGTGVGTLRFVRNSKPVPASFKQVVAEDTKAFDGELRLEYTDADREMCQCWITKLPERGTLRPMIVRPYVKEHGEAKELGEAISSVPMLVNSTACAVVFEPGAEEVGLPYTTFEFKVTDAASEADLANLDAATVTINVVPSNDPVKIGGVGDLAPGAVAEMRFDTTDSRPLVLDLDLTDPDGELVTGMLTAAPKNGRLYEVDAAGAVVREIGLSAPPSQELMQWAATVTATEEYTNSSYSAARAAGPPTRPLLYGDSRDSWCVRHTSRCDVNEGDGEFFASGSLHLTFNESVFMNDLFIYENYGPGGAVVAVKARHPSGEWHRLHLTAAEKPSKQGVHRRYSPDSMCGTDHPTREVKVFYDSCAVPGWHEIDAFLLVGTRDDNPGWFRAPHRLMYVPNPGYGDAYDTFAFRATDCLGDLFRRTPEVTVTVSAAPHAGNMTKKPGTGDTTFDLKAMGLTPPLTVWALPDSGTGSALNSGGRVVEVGDTLRDGVFVYRLDACASSHLDQVAVMDADGRYFKVGLVGCSSVSFPSWVFWIIAAVVVLAGVAGGWQMSAQQRAYAKVYSNNRVATDCAEAIAKMRLEELDHLYELKKPNSIQQAFIEIIEKLKEYRTYMPESVLVNNDDDDDLSNASGESPVHMMSESSFSAPYRDSPVRRGSSVCSLQGRPGGARAAMSLQVRLNTHRMTVVVTNVTGWLKHASTKSNLDLIGLYSDYLVKFSAVVNGLGGIIDALSGDRSVVTFNAIRSCCDHYFKSLMLPLLMVKENVSAPLGGGRMTFGCSTGQCKAGNLGTDKMRKFTLIGSELGFASKLEEFARQHKLSCVMGDEFFDKIVGQYAFQIVAGALMPKRRGNGIIIVAELISAHTVSCEEWMYNLDAVMASDRDLNEFNTYASALCRGVAPEGPCPNPQRRSGPTARIVAAAKSGEYRPYLLDIMAVATYGLHESPMLPIEDVEDSDSAVADDKSDVHDYDQD